MKLGLGLEFTRSGSLRLPANPVSGMVLHLDASDVSTITNVAGRATQWRDKNGNGKVANAVSTGPTTGVLTMNGLNALGFSTNSAERMTVADHPDFNNNNGLTVYAVSRFSALGAFCTIVGRYSTATNREWSITKRNTDLMYGSFTTDGATGILLGNIATAALNTPLLTYIRSTPAGPIEFGRNSANPDQRIPGSNTIFSSSNALAITIGEQGTGTGTPMTGVITEIIIYNRPLTDAEHDQNLRYIEAKWGILTTRTTEFLNTMTRGQSNMLLQDLDNATYTNEGRIAYQAALAQYYKEYFYYRGAVDATAVYQPADTGANGFWVNTDFSISTLYNTVRTNSIGSLGLFSDPLRYKALLYAHMEADSVALGSGLITKANSKTAYLALMDQTIADHGSDCKIVVFMLGRRTGGSDLGYQLAKDIILEAAAERPSNIITVEMYDQPLQDTIHYTPAGYTVLGGRAGQAMAAAFGRRSIVGTIGPIISSATYSGSTVTATLTLDGGAAISGTDVAPFRIEDDGVAVTINSLSIAGNQITFNLASSISGGSVVRLWNNYGQGSSVTPANVIKDTNGNPVRTISNLVVT